MLVVGALTIIFIIIAVAPSLRSALEARRALQLLEQVDSGRSSVSELISFLNSSKKVVQRSTSCGLDDCDAGLMFLNGSLYKAHLARPAQLLISVRVSSGKLIYVHSTFNLGSLRDNSVMTLVADRELSGEQLPFQSVFPKTGEGHGRAIAAAGAGASYEQQKAIYQLNYWCLAKLGGCQTLPELSPKLYALSRESRL